MPKKKQKVEDKIDDTQHDFPGQEEVEQEEVEQEEVKVADESEGEKVEEERVAQEDADILNKNLIPDDDPNVQGPVFPEDPDEPDPRSFVSMACSLCHNFPCMDTEIDKRSWKIPTAKELMNNYKVPPCKQGTSQILGNFEPRQEVFSSQVDYNTEEELRGTISALEIDVDKSQYMVAEWKKKATHILAFLERELQRVANMSAEASSRQLKKVGSEVLNRFIKNVLPEYKKD